MFLRTNSTQLTAKSSTLLIKWLLFVGALLAAWSMAGGEVKAATSARLTRPGLARPGPGSTSSFEPAALVTIDGQKSFFQPFLGRDLEIRGFFPYFLSPNPLIPAKTFLEDYTTATFTGTQVPPAETTPTQFACPAGEPTWPAISQGGLVRHVFQTAAGLAGTIQPGAQFKERVNILLLGSDSRPGEKYGRTDAMILVTVDPVAKTAGLLSIPRDLWVVVPGYGEARINQAHRIGGVKKYPGGGAALAAATVEATLGVPVHYYAAVDFAGFQQAIDLLNGIDICVPESIDAATYYGYTPESINKAEYYSYVPAPAETIAEVSTTANVQPAVETAGAEMDKGYKFLYIEAGFHTLDGEAALSYARSRASATADFARVQRQQAVLFALKNKAFQPGVIAKLPELWAALGQTVETNVTLAEAFQLAQLAYEIDPAQIQTAAISHEQTTSYRTASGASVLLPKRAEMKALVEQMFGSSNPTAPLTQPELEAAPAIAQVGPMS